MRSRCCLYDTRFIQGEKISMQPLATGSVKLPSCHDRQRLEEKRVEINYCMTDTTD
jgi:hypothetical protein